MNVPPRGLQNTLIFYITCIIVVTNGFFAVITLSRENLNSYSEGMTRSVFLAQILQHPAREYLVQGLPQALERIWGVRPPGMTDVKVTLYDANWWPRWGDPGRIPLEGFPPREEMTDIAYRPGVSGQSAREIYVPITSGTQYVGALGVGVPLFGGRNIYEIFFPVIMTMLVNIFLGITLSVFIAQVILRPLGNLLDGLDGIKRGDYGQRVAVSEGGQELRVLGEMFNLMAVSLQEKIKEGLERTRVLDEKVQELWEIYELTKEMSFSLNLQQILGRFLEKAQTLSFSSYGQILLYQLQGNRLETQVETPAFPLVIREDYDRSVQLCLQSAQPVEVVSRGFTMLFLPLMSGRLVQGVLFLAKRGEQFYTEGVRRFLETIAPLGGSLIENAQLYQHVVEMKDYVRNVLNSVDSGVATLDLDSRLVTMNASLSRVLDLPDLQAAFQSFHDILGRLGDASFAEEVDRLLQMPSSRLLSRLPPVSLPLQQAGKDPRILQVRVHPLQAGTDVIGLVLVFDDLTTLKHIERRMLESEKWAVLGRLAASVAHEIRNPLVSIRSLVEIIGEEQTGEGANHVKVVLGEVDRLNKVVAQLLNLARPEKTLLRSSSLTDLLEELFLLVRHEAQRSRVELERAWSLTSVYVRMDPEKIKQAFLNVMLNAIQAMEEGGVLTIGLTMVDGGSLPTMEGKEVMIEFSDTGHGIPTDLRERIFDPFFTTRPTGTGLGLAITKKIVDLHHGSIQLDDNPGRGTRFRITLPGATSGFKDEEG